MQEEQARTARPTDRHSLVRTNDLTNIRAHTCTLIHLCNHSRYISHTCNKGARGDGSGDSGRGSESQQFERARESTARHLVFGRVHHERGIQQHGVDAESRQKVGGQPIWGDADGAVVRGLLGVVL